MDKHADIRAAQEAANEFGDNCFVYVKKFQKENKS